jgi:hypothetical protein
MRGGLTTTLHKPAVSPTSNHPVSHADYSRRTDAHRTQRNDFAFGGESQDRGVRCAASGLGALRWVGGAFPLSYGQS